MPGPTQIPPDTTARTPLAELLEAARRRDLPGHRVHVVLAFVYLFLLPLATAPKDIAFGLLVGISLVRLPHTLPIMGRVGRMPLVLALLGWTAWSALSIAWSADVAAGADELKSFRVVLTPFLLAPVLNQLPALVVSFLAGVVAQNTVQGLQWAGWMEAGWANRMRGLLHPIHTGALCVAALWWNLMAVLRFHGWPRWLSAAALAMAAGGLVLTGSRGPWLAAAATLLLAVPITAIRRPETRRTMLVLAIIGCAGVAASWPVLQPRIARAADELTGAFRNEDYGTSVGLRIALNRWGLEVFTRHPVLGVGAGGFHDALAQVESHEAAVTRSNRSFLEGIPGYREAIESGRPPEELDGYESAMRKAARRARFLTPDHAHSVYLHTLASTGLVGGLLLAGVLITALRSAWRNPSDHPYSEAVLFVLIAWFVGAEFDAYHLNGHLFGLFGFVAALCLRAHGNADARS